MESGCQNVQEELIERSGESVGLRVEEREHLAGCQECRAVAEAERSLNLVFSQALPVADLEGSVMGSISRSRLGRRALVATPVAVSLAVAVLGAWLMGGMPGGGLVGLLPLRFSQGWVAIVEMIGNWGVVIVASSNVVSSALSMAAVVCAQLVMLVGIGSTYFLARRWRSSAAWLRGD